jgi:uroporphyrinogen decarboxylase
MNELTPRERYIQTLLFRPVDKVPFEPGGPRESTIANWRTQGLPAGAGWYEHLFETLGLEIPHTQDWVDIGADFRMIPQFEEKVLEHKGGHYIVQDWKGNICEISDRFDVTYLRTAKDFVTRAWLKCPVQNRQDWERMKLRYDLNSPGRFAPDFADRCRRAGGRDWPMTVGFSGPFWQMREWCGFEGLCLMMIEQPELVDEMADFWGRFVSAMLDRILGQVTPDIVYFSEDMAYKAKAMISPAMARRFCQPCWVQWSRQARAAGVPVVSVDSDGYIGELIPLWIESGVNDCNPIEAAAQNDIIEFRRRFGRTMAYRGGVDKRAMAKGGTAIREELSRLGPVVRDGGFIPSCDHGVPADVSWPNFVEYSRLLARMTGWL